MEAILFTQNSEILRLQSLQDSGQLAEVKKPRLVEFPLPSFLYQFDDKSILMSSSLAAQLQLAHVGSGDGTSAGAAERWALRKKSPGKLPRSEMTRLRTFTCREDVVLDRQPDSSPLCTLSRQVLYTVSTNSRAFS